MMHGQDFFFQALIYLAAAVISVPLAKRLGLGSVLGYLLAGIIIGPHVFHLVGEEGTDVMHFAEFGVVMMLFLIGLELKPSLLWEMKRSIFGLGGLQLILTALVIGSIALMFGLNTAQALTVGLTLALSSTAIILQSLSEKGLLRGTGGQSSFSVLLFQDLALIPILAILPLLANQVDAGTAITGGYTADAVKTGVSALPGWQQLLLILGVVASIIAGGRFLARYLFRIIALTGLREIFTATALLLVVAITVAMNLVGLSPALGTFLAGVVLADNEYRHELESNIQPFKGLLLGLFFLAVGASIDFSILLEQPSTVLSLVGILIAVKFLVLLILGSLFGLRSGQQMLFSFALAQSGEFAFVLLSFSSQNAILDNDTSGILLIVVALSMLVTPLLLIINDRLVQPLMVRTVTEEKADKIDEQHNPVIIAGFGRFGLVIGRFLRANGVKATILDNNPNNIKILRKSGFKVFYGDASRIDLLRAAGAERASIIIIAVESQDKITEIAEHVQRHFPHLKIFSRAVSVEHFFELTDLSVAGIRRETYDASLNLGVQALCAIGFNKYQSERAARYFRYHDEEVMQELHKHWNEDKNKYISEARRFTEQLENLLMAEQENSIHDADAAWDIESRREEVKKMNEAMNKDKPEN